MAPTGSTGPRQLGVRAGALSTLGCGDGLGRDVFGLALAQVYQLQSTHISVLVFLACHNE